MKISLCCITNASLGHSGCKCGRVVFIYLTKSLMSKIFPRESK